MGGREALRLLASSRQVQLIALLIGFAGLGAMILNQQLSLAIEDRGLDAITTYLASVRVLMSLMGLSSRSA